MPGPAVAERASGHVSEAGAWTPGSTRGAGGLKPEEKGAASQTKKRATSAARATYMAPVATREARTPTPTGGSTVHANKRKKRERERKQNESRGGGETPPHLLT